METVAVFGGAASPSFSSSLQRSSSAQRSCSLSYAHHKSNLRTCHYQLAAFPSKSHLFSYFQSRHHAKTLAKPRIFLPHLVASLVGLSSFSLFDWKPFNFGFISEKPSWNYWHFICCVGFQEQVEETYIMVKPDGVQRGLVSPSTILCCVCGNVSGYLKRLKLWILIDSK